MRRGLPLLILLLFAINAPADEGGAIPWRGWEGAFEVAKAEDRLVLLNLEAVWCHWCHVMAETTYKDPRVVSLLGEHVVPVKVDQDARPDLGLRYQQYGWPATIIFDSQGRELARLSGYQDPDEMAAVLRKLLNDPEPLPDEKPPAQASTPLDAVLASLQEAHYRRYDRERGGWGRVHKFVNSRVVEYCLERSLAGSQDDEMMACTTLSNNLVLIDPVWGGVYQYSDSGRWDSPHYEKIMSTQAGNLRVYSLAYAQYRDPAYLDAARRIAGYMSDFLRSPEGAFRPSQDADLIQGKKAHDYFALSDSERRKLGVPRVDANLYARENGWAIEALALYSGIAGDPVALRQALQAADWVLLHRRRPGGEFAHGDSGEGVFLGDTLACGRGFLALYQATGDACWLERAMECGQVMGRLFVRSDVDGLVTAVGSTVRAPEENVDAARFANLLFHYSGRPSDRALAEEALSFFMVEGATEGFNGGAVLLANDEMKRDPTHITVVGDASSDLRRQLAEAARSGPSSYLRLDIWAPGTPLPANSQLEYPSRPPVAAYICAAGRCSPPVVTVESLRGVLSSRR